MMGGSSSSSSQAMRLGLWLRYWVGQRLAPFHGTPPHVARRMLELAGVRANDRVFDLGCGDARLLIAGETPPLITLERKDALLVDLSTATVVTLYLTVKGNDKLYPKLCQQLPEGARVVSFCWPFESLEPSRTMTVDGIKLFLYEFNRQPIHQNIQP